MVKRTFTFTYIDREGRNCLKHISAVSFIDACAEFKVLVGGISWLVQVLDCVYYSPAPESMQVKADKQEDSVG